MEDDGALNFDFEGGLDAVTAASGQAAPPQAMMMTSGVAGGAAMAAAGGQVGGQAGGQRGPMRRSFRQTVCRHWLRGLCMKGNDCGFLHQFDKSRMPLCRFFARFGVCREPDCIYKHSTEDIKECNMYKLGFCPNGPDCRYRHEKLPGPPPPVEHHLVKLQQRYQPDPSRYQQQRQPQQQQQQNHQAGGGIRPDMVMNGPKPPMMVASSPYAGGYGGPR